MINTKTYKILVGTPEGKGPLGRRRSETSEKCIVRKQGMRMWSGFKWLGAGTSGGLLLRR
jgi:hypothetical protein